MSELIRCTAWLGPTLCATPATERLSYHCNHGHTAHLLLCSRHAGQHRAGEIRCHTCRGLGVLRVPMELIVDEPLEAS